MNIDRWVIRKAFTILFSIYLFFSVPGSLLAGEQEDYQEAKIKNQMYYWEFYLRRYPVGKYKKEALEALHQLYFEWAKKFDMIESYDKYLERYPDSPHLKEVQTRMDAVLFKNAESDWYSSYEKYIKRCPDYSNVEKARNRIAWLKANKAEAVIEYESTIEETKSPYLNVYRPFWPIDIVFKETSGKIGFRVSGGPARLDAIRGRSFSDSGRPMVKVPAGGTVKDHEWFSDSRHELCNGYMKRTWSGEDAGGHPIRLEQTIKLQHTGCPFQ